MEDNKDKKEELPVIKKKRQSGKRKPKEHVSSKPKPEITTDQDLTTFVEKNNPFWKEGDQKIVQEITTQQGLDKLVIDPLEQEYVIIKTRALGPGGPDMTLYSSKEIVQEQSKELSKMAEGWRKWLIYQNITPEAFLTRYPTQKFRHCIEEIIAFQAQK